MKKNFFITMKTKGNACFLLFLAICGLMLPQRVCAADSVRVNLQKALQIALSESPTIRIADRDVQTKKYYKSEQIASFFPDVSLSASYQRTLKKQVMTMQMGGQPMSIEVGTDNNYVAGLSLSLPLVMPTMWYNMKITNMDVELALESARSSKLSLVKEVKKAFYAVLLAQESYDVLMRNFQNVEMTNQNIANKYEQGMASEFDKLRAEVQLKNQKPNITAAENAIKLTSMMLKVLMGVDINEPMAFEGKLADFDAEVSNATTPDIKSFNLSQNSDLKQMDYALEELKLSKKIVTSSACPTLAMMGTYQYMAMNNDFKFSEYNWVPYSYIGFSLNIPIISWVGTSYKMKQTDLSILNMEENRKTLEKNLWVSITNSLNSISKATEDMTSNKETMQQAEKAYSIVQRQYELGMATWLDLNSAELALVSTQLAYYQAIYDYLSAKADLDNVLGKE